jgi:hypothetical protein
LTGQAIENILDREIISTTYSRRINDEVKKQHYEKAYAAHTGTGDYA